MYFKYTIPCVNKTASEIMYGVFLHFEGGRLLIPIEFKSYVMLKRYAMEP